MRRVLTICLLALAAVLVAAPAALAASGPAPTITRVQPMRVSVGNLLTITGSHFKAQRTRNTVIFRGPNGRTAFAKPRRSTTRKLVVRVPAAVARLLRVSGSRQRPTRLKLRVLSGQFSKFTTRRLSPVVTGVGDGDGGPGGGGGGGGGGTVVCNDSADHDGDLLPNTLELAIGTDPCLADTDNDQMTDGWEYWSAKDLNIKAVPYPGKRPFPNALDPSDGAPAPARFSNIDFDGDGLTSVEEYRAWRYTGSAFDASKARWARSRVAARLQRRHAVQPRGRDAGRALPGRARPTACRLRAEPFPATLNLHGDGAWRDDERDADGDGMANYIESVHGPGQPSWWAGFYARTPTRPSRGGPSPRRPAARRSSAPSTSGPSRSWTWRTPTSTATRSSTARTIRTTTTSRTSARCTRVCGLDLDGDGGFNCGGTRSTRRRSGRAWTGRQRVQPLRPESRLAYVRCLEALRVDPFPVVPPPTWRPHPRL